MGFTKLDDAFASSSIFSLGLDVVGFWAYLMSQADAHGRITATVPDMAARCRTTPERIQALLELLQQPDPWSRTPDHGGRRVEVMRDPEWAVILLNHGKYRAKRDPEKRREQVREAVRRHRHVSHDVIQCKPSKPRKAQAEAEAEAEGKQEGGPSPLPPDIQGERLLHESRVAKERRFYAYVSQLAAMQPEKDPPDIARELTGYTAKDGRKVRGVVRPELLTEERLDRSLEDAQWWVEELTKPKEASSGA